MKHLFILLSLMAVNGDDNIFEECEGIVYKGIHYDKEVLKNASFPRQLTTDYSTNVLYFFYDIDWGMQIALATLYLNTKEFHSNEIEDMIVPSVAIDAKTKSFFLGTASGVYKYDKEKNIAEFYGASNKTIASPFFKDGVLYFAAVPSLALYSLEKGVATIFEDLNNTKVYLFYIDKDDDMLYANATGLFRQKKGSKDAVYYEDSNINWIEGITADVNGDVFVYLKDGIYSADKEKNRLVKQLSVENPNGLAFDKKNNMIYATASEIVRITLSKDQDCLINEY